MNPNYINLKGNKLELGFRYDPAIVEAIKSIDGRLFNKLDKKWTIPVTNLNETLEKLVPFGFIPHPAVKALSLEEDKFLKRIDEIRSSEIHYEGALPLYGFQKIGAQFIREMPSCLLADVPGLGKSIQTIAGTEHDEQILIFTMASLKYTFEDEIKKWLPDARTLVVDGDKKKRNYAWNVAKNGNVTGGVRVKPKYILANYELLIHDYEEIKDYPWGTVVCDEATRISNPDAATTKNLKTLKSKKRVALTGTPISNRPDDIWSIMDWLMPGFLGSFYQFRKKYCVVEEEYGRGREYTKVTGYQNLETLKEKVGRFMLRRIKEEVLTDFPKKTIENIVFDLSAQEKSIYKAIKEQVHKEIKELTELNTNTLAIIPVKLLRLKQCTDHTRLVGDKIHEGWSSKLDTVKELLEPIMASGEKAIIFTQFSEMLHILVEELKEYAPVAIYGAVDNVDRWAIVQDFNKKEGAGVIIMTEAGAYGLNMQSASYVFHYDHPWSVAKLQQREDRAHRIGQVKPVTVYNMIAKGTVDEYILKVLKKKNEVSVDILKDAERLEDVGLSEVDIKEILRL
jgi:SNF2 family DNA or RNA helicase